MGVWRGHAPASPPPLSLSCRCHMAPPVHQCMRETQAQPYPRHASPSTLQRPSHGCRDPVMPSPPPPRSSDPPRPCSPTTVDQATPRPAPAQQPMPIPSPSHPLFCPPRECRTTHARTPEFCAPTPPPTRDCRRSEIAVCVVSILPQPPPQTENLPLMSTPPEEEQVVSRSARRWTSSPLS